MTDGLIKISVMIIISASLSVLLYQYKPEYSMMISALCAVAVLMTVLKNTYPSIIKIRSIIEKSGSSYEYFSVAVKSLGIAYISAFTADTCRDFGQTSLASKAEFAGKCAVFVLSVPLMCSVLEAALEFADL